VFCQNAKPIVEDTTYSSAPVFIWYSLIFVGTIARPINEMLIYNLQNKVVFSMVLTD
jgi:hypothetical protein